MPQISRTTSGMSVINVSWLQGRITALKLKMTVGGSITATDFNELVSIYNYWILHKHTSSDLKGIGFGDLPSYSTSGEYVTAISLTPTGKTSSSDTVTADVTEITPTEVNAIIAKINGIRSHTHSIVDTIS